MGCLGMIYWNLFSFPQNPFFLQVIIIYLEGIYSDFLSQKFEDFAIFSFPLHISTLDEHSITTVAFAARCKSMSYCPKCAF